MLPKILENYDADAIKKLRGGPITIGDVYAHSESSRGYYPNATSDVTYYGKLLSGFKCEPTPDGRGCEYTPGCEDPRVHPISLGTIAGRGETSSKKSQGQVAITCPVDQCEHQFVTKAKSVLFAISVGMVLDPSKANRDFFNSSTWTDHDIEKKT